MPLKSIHVTENGNISLFLMAEWYSIVYLNHIFFIHSSIEGHLGYFHTLVAVNNTTLNIGVYGS